MRIERVENIEAWQMTRELTRKVIERKVTLPEAGKPDRLPKENGLFFWY